MTHVSRALQIARQHTSGEIFHACVAFIGVAVTTFMLPGEYPTLWYPAIAVLFGVLCYFPVPIVMLRGRICGANIGDVAMLVGLAVGARGSMLPALFTGLVVATVMQVRRGEWPGRQVLFINTMIMAQIAITPAMVQIMAPTSSHLERAMWLPLGLSYVVRGFFWPLMSLAVSRENRTRSAFVATLKAAFTVAIFVDLMTAAAALVVTTLLEQSPVALIPATFVGLGVVLTTKSRRDNSESAARDDLTGALNRRGFTAEYQHQIANHHSGSLLILDIDRFKSVNDELGHLAGDNVLCHLVKQAKAVLPPESILGRLGGDEFVIVVFDTDDVDTLVCEIRTAVASDVEGFPGLQCAISIGVTAFASSDSLSDIMQRADHNMYGHKRASRNGVLLLDAGSVAMQSV